MKQYTDLLQRILKEGRRKENRTGVDTISLLGPQMEFDMSDGYPLLDLREIPFEHVRNENIWFLGGVCNNEDLVAMGTKFWSKWALKEDFVVEEMRQVPTVVNEYIFVRLKEDGLEITEATPIEEANAMRQKYVDELHAADKRDNEAGLPTLIDAKGAINHNQLMGGFAEIRKYPDIKFGDDRVVATKGFLGPIYGVLWRRWMGHEGRAYDQIGTMLAKLGSDNPKLRYSRCNIVTAFQPSVLPDETIGAEENIKIGRQALAACHTFFQLFAEPLTLAERVELHNLDVAKKEQAHIDSAHPADVDWAYLNVDALWTLSSIPAQDFTDADGHAVLDKFGVARDQLSLKLYQRSADFPVGVPFNIAGYSLLLLMFCKQLNMKPAKFIHTFGDAHIYVDQIEGVEELLKRVEINQLQVGKIGVEIADGVESMFEYKPEHFKLVNYSPMQPQIKFPVAV